MLKASEESNLDQSLSGGVKLSVRQSLSGSPGIVLILWVAHPRADAWHLQHEEAPRTLPPCPSGSCLLLSWIMTTTTMAISQNGWAATGGMEQKSDQTESEDAVSGDLQKPIMTEGLHSQQWWEPAFGERMEQKLASYKTQKQPPNWTN